MAKITPFLWFDTEGEDAAKFYVSVFPNSRIIRTTHYEGAIAEASGRPVGLVMTVDFELDGNPFTALNGGTMYKITEGISFSVPCRDQAEIDHYWNAFASDGGEELACGWVKDKFGVCWQVDPAEMGTWMSDPVTGPRVAEAMLTMVKLDYDALKRAYEGK